MFASYEVATSFPSLTAIKGYDLDKSADVPLMGHQKWKWYPNISIFFSLENGGKRQNYLIQLFNGDRPIHTHTPSLIICLSFTQTFETWTERRHWRNQLWLKQLRNTLAEAQSMGLVTSLTEGLALWIVFFGCSWSLPFWALLLPWHGTSGPSGETNR